MGGILDNSTYQSDYLYINTLIGLNLINASNKNGATAQELANTLFIIPSGKIINPVDDIERILGNLRKVSDGQLISKSDDGVYYLDLQKTPIDFIAASAHKFHGPKGVGFTYINKSTKIKSFISGGPQERGLRAGTESVHNIVGMTKALEIANKNMDKETNYVSTIKKYMIENLIGLFPNIHFNGESGDMTNSTYTVLNVCFPISNDKAAMLDFQLDLKGIACSKGSACQSGSSEGSHVLSEIQDDSHKIFPSVRFSFSHNNKKEEVDYLIETLKEFISS